MQQTQSPARQRVSRAKARKLSLACGQYREPYRGYGYRLTKPNRPKCPTCGRRAPGNPGKSKRDALIRKSKLSPANLATIYHVSVERIYQIRGKK